MNWKQAIWVVAGCALVSAPALSQTGSPTASTARTPTTREGVILARIHRDNQNEIELANLARERASSDAVKRLANRILTDHLQTDDQVIAFAKSHNIEISVTAQRAAVDQMQRDEARSKAVGSAAGEYTRMTSGIGGAGIDSVEQDAHDSTIAKLRNLKGVEFDREFVNVMVTDHQRTIDRLTKARSEIRDSDTVALIDKLLPTFKRHLNMAQRVQKNLSS